MDISWGMNVRKTVKESYVYQGSRKNKFAILGVEAPAWQGVKTQKYPDIPSFRNAARRDASASKM
jgi:hypothetical protein